MSPPPVIDCNSESAEGVNILLCEASVTKVRSASNSTCFRLKTIDWNTSSLQLIAGVYDTMKSSENHKPLQNGPARPFHQTATVQYGNPMLENAENLLLF
jgi:hypothetical protein